MVFNKGINLYESVVDFAYTYDDVSESFFFGREQDCCRVHMDAVLIFQTETFKYR